MGHGGPLPVRCGYDTPASGTGQGEVFGTSHYGRDFVHTIIDNPPKSIILNILKNYRDTADKKE
jgi:hypothetical protein